MDQWQRSINGQDRRGSAIDNIALRIEKKTANDCYRTESISGEFRDPNSQAKNEESRFFTHGKLCWNGWAISVDRKTKTTKHTRAVRCDNVCVCVCLLYSRDRARARALTRVCVRTKTRSCRKNIINVCTECFMQMMRKANMRPQNS